MPSLVAQECNLSLILIHPRFAVQILQADGSIAHRPVDHVSWSAAQRRKKEASVNGHTCPSECFFPDDLDDLGQVGGAGALHSYLYMSDAS